MIRATAAGTALVLTCAPGYGATTAVVRALQATADVQWLSLDALVPDQLAAGMVTDVVSGDHWYVVDGVIPELHKRTCEVLRDVTETLKAPARLVVIAEGRLDLPGARVHDEGLLQFTDDEAMDLLTGLVPEVDVDAATRLIEDAQGWASALVAGALRLRDGLTADRVSTAMPSELLTPWLEALAPARRQLLETISVLDEFSEPLVSAVTANPDIASQLADLIDSHAYVLACAAPDGHQGQWWRLHPMLIALLRQRAAGAPGMAHSRAGTWFAQVGDLSRGMAHYIAAGRYRDAVDLLDRHQDGLLATGSADTVLRWYTEIAEGHDHRVECLLRAAWGRLLSGDVVGADAAMARLTAAVEAVLRNPEAPQGQQWRSELALLESYMAALHGDPATVVRAAQASLDFPSLDQNPSVAQLSPLLIVRGYLWGGDYGRAAVAVADCAGIEFSKPVVGTLHYQGARALMHCHAGEIAAAARIVDETWAWAERNEIDIEKLPTFAADLARAAVLLEQGDLDQAGEVAAAVARRAQERQHISDATTAMVIEARVMLFRGQTGAALQHLGLAAEAATTRTADSLLLVPIGHVQAQAHIAAGDMLRAERLLRELPVSRTRTLLSAQAGLVRTPVQARKTLEAVSVSEPRSVAQRHLLLAAAHLKTSERIAGEHLKAAAATARRAGMRMLLAPPEPGVRELAEQLAEAGDSDVAWVLSGFVPSTGESSVLSRGDLQLLALIPTRAKNQEIAAVLGISVNTVKTRLRRLYTVLGVSNRDEAIATARTRGLLP